MTFGLQNFMNAVFGAGKSKAAEKRREKTNRLVPEGTRFRGKFTSRQIERAKLRDGQYRATTLSSTVTGNRSFQPEPRKARRQMARALATAAWKSRNRIAGV